MRTVDRILGWTLLAFGLLHTIGGIFQMSRNLNLDTSWFFSGGLAIIFCAFLNLVRAQREDKMIARTSVIANLMLVILSVLLCWVLRPDLKTNPQAVVLLLLAILELLFSVRQWLR
jgi:hypothetical protein